MAGIDTIVGAVAAAVQGLTAVVAVGFTAFTLQRDRRREQREEYGQMAAAFDLVVELGRFLRAAEQVWGASLAVSADMARRMLRSGEFRELVSLLDDVKPSQVSPEASDAYRDARALVRDIEGWLQRVAAKETEERIGAPLGSWQSQFERSHDIMLKAVNRAAAPRRFAMRESAPRSDLPLLHFRDDAS